MAVAAGFGSGEAMAGEGLPPRPWRVSLGGQQVAEVEAGEELAADAVGDF